MRRPLILYVTPTNVTPPRVNGLNPSNAGADDTRAAPQGAIRMSNVSPLGAPRSARSALCALWLSAICLLCAQSLNAQVVSAPGARSPVKKLEAARQELPPLERATRGEVPYSRAYDFIRVEAQAIHRLPPLDESEKRQEAGPDKKLRIGAVRAFQSPLEILSGVTPHSVAGGEVRLMGVVSEGAVFTRIHFDKTSLPDGARLFVYSMNDPEEVYGPYEGRGPSEEGDFWTPPVKGDAVVIEYFSPSGAAEEGAKPFEVVGVSHGFIDPLSGDTQFAAGACNLEVPPAFATTATGVGLLDYMLPDGEHTCTGTLLNTQSSSFIPYLITANHCFSTQASAQSLRVFWHYNTGEVPVGSPVTDGSTLLATGTASDFTFVRLTGVVPGGLLYNGWTTAMPALGTSVVGIHHPEASHKRFSYGFVTDPYCFSKLPGPCQNFLTVFWNGGTVEHGSSGSELILGTPPNTAYVGNLWGGDVSCDNPFGRASYGRFDVTYPNVAQYLADAGNCTPPATGVSIGSFVGGSLTTGDCRSPLRGTSYYADRFAFFGSAGQTVTINLSSASMDTYLYLKDPFGGVYQDDDGGGGTDSRIQITLPATGTYVAEVTSYSPNVTGSYTFGVSAVAGGAGSRTAGLFNPATSTFFLRNSNSAGGANAAFPFGPANSGWLPVAGDWNADGVQSIGLFNPVTSTFFLKNFNSAGPADLAFSYGPAGAGWIPLAGDWNGDGVQTVGLYSPSTSSFFLRNSNSAGAANVIFGYGPSGSGWMPIVGDWNGDGVDTVGLYNPFTSTFFLRNTNSSGPANIVFSYGPAAGWKPIAGDWNGDGIDTVGLYNPVTSTFFLRDVNAGGPADWTFSYGPAGAGWTALGGNWDGL